jgi:large subunit ribosomal protein L20
VLKRGFKRRRRINKVFKLAKGYHFDRRTKFRMAKSTVERALHNAYKGRRLLKRNMRRLWITRISAGAKQLGTSYSRVIHSLKQNNVDLNRKMLSELAARDFDAFKAVVEANK